ncbi:hypothetical protein ICY20_08050 [Pseudomonas sp. P115]|uniref:DUF7716 domain-containing protein n=1 Tax=Pseudomonas pisciculturae TaxID=2730413 RepID=UPI0013586CEF|nr:hypothetical protein [Pseudomonas pisciculturae]MBF6027684.1 hypothetical protein [Pseudomonas pisciculturae]
MKLISIRDVLTSPENNPQGWFYLPPDSAQWSPETLGVFSLDSSDFPPDSDDYLPKQAKEDGWIATLETSAIEDVVDNAKDQLPAASAVDLFNAFLFYFENDAFIEY